MEIKQLYKIFLSCQQKISTDTRKIEEGSLFFALKGANFNGNTFTQKALELGAAFSIIDEAEYVSSDKCILVDDVLHTLQQLANYHRNQFSIPVFGITGSNGKTTSKELVGAVLSTQFEVLVTEGNLNNHIGVPLTLFKLKPNHQIAIIEMGANKPGDIAELSAIAQPNFGVITNIGKAHIEGFGSLEGVEKTKKELYQSIFQSKGTLFINADDELLMRSLPSVDLVTYGNTGNISGKVVDMNPFLVFKWKNVAANYESNNVPTQLVGDYNLPNFLLAITIGTYFKIPNETISWALEKYTPSNNRSQITKTEHNTLIVDCYNANVSSMELSIKNFANMKVKNGWAILGNMLELGDISKQEHQNIVDLVVRLNLKAHFVGSEFLKVTIPTNYQVFDQTTDLMTYLKQHPITDATVLLKGSRGTKLETLIQEGKV